MSEQDTGAIVITGDKIEGARWLSVRSMLKLEIAGMRRSRGPSARVLANQITGSKASTARKAYDALNAHIVAHLGSQFDRSL